MGGSVYRISAAVEIYRNMHTNMESYEQKSIQIAGTLRPFSKLHDQADQVETVYLTLSLVICYQFICFECHTLDCSEYIPKNVSDIFCNIAIKIDIITIYTVIV